MSFIAFLLGLTIYFAIRVGIGGFFTVRPDQRAVKTSFGRAERLGGPPTDDPTLNEDERQRYNYSQVRVIPPGGPYLKMPWQKVHKVSVATQSVDIVWDPTKQQDTIEAVTKDNLTTGVTGQLRYRLRESNLYPYLFGVTRPLQHVMGYFVSVLRERIATFVDPKGASLVVSADLEEGSATSLELSEGVSINDLRKNLPLLNQYMEEQCQSTAGRYGIEPRRSTGDRDRSTSGGRSGAIGDQLDPQPGGGRHLHRACRR